MKEKSMPESFLIPPRKPREYAEYSKYVSEDSRHQTKDPLRTNFESSLVLRQRLAYSYSEYVTHTVLHRISTIQWLPELHQEDQTQYHQFLFGTNDNDSEEYYYEKNYLYVFGFVVPKDQFNGEIDKCRIHKFEMKGFAPFKLPTVLKKIFVRDPVKLARYMPQKSNFIATIGYNSNQINIFDTNKHSRIPKNVKNKVKSNILLGTNSTLKHFDWNSKAYGTIIGGCNDGTISIWDINSKKIQSDKETKPIHTFQAFDGTGIVNCFCHPFSDNIAAVSSEEADFSFFDIRTSNENSAIHTFKPHSSALSTISLSPFNEHLFVTGSFDNNVKLWDLRHMKRDIYTFQFHDPVTQVQFSPHCPHMLAAATTDPSITILNCNKMGRIQPPDHNIQDGYAEVQFIHFQRQKITDFSWGPPEHPWRFASVDDSIAFNLWTPSLKSVYENI